METSHFLFPVCGTRCDSAETFTTKNTLAESRRRRFTYEHVSKRDTGDTGGVSSLGDPHPTPPTETRPQTLMDASVCPVASVCPDVSVCPVCPDASVCPVCPDVSVCPVCPDVSVCPDASVCPVCPVPSGVGT